MQQRVHTICDQIPPEYICVYTPIAMEFVDLTHQQHDTDLHSKVAGVLLYLRRA
jgi:hypothetical protein